MQDVEILYLAKGEIHHVPLSYYPSGEPLIKHEPTFVPEAVLVRQTCMDTFMAAMFWIDALADRGHPVPRLVLPFVPGARQDRINDKGDYLFTAKSVARMINARRFPSVTILDPHSDVTPALIDRCDVAHARIAGGGGYQGIIAPDGGAEKRAKRVAEAMQLPMYHAWKNRDVRTGDIMGFGIQPIPPSGHYMVVDDICDGGGTFVGLAPEIKRRGATADLFVTHGLFTKGTELLLNVFEKVYSTDSTVRDKPGVIVIPTCENLLRGT